MNEFLRYDLKNILISLSILAMMVFLFFPVQKWLKKIFAVSITKFQGILLLLIPIFMVFFLEFKSIFLVNFILIFVLTWVFLFILSLDSKVILFLAFIPLILVAFFLFMEIPGLANNSGILFIVIMFFLLLKEVISANIIKE